MPQPSTSVHVDLPPGGYAVHPDPYEPWRSTYWRVGIDGSLEPWPSGESDYGPQRPDVAGLDESARRMMRRDHRVRVRAYRQTVADRIVADPRAAAILFAALAGRCAHCRTLIKDADIPHTADSAAAAADPAQALARTALQLAGLDRLGAARLLAAAGTLAPDLAPAGA